MLLGSAGYAVKASAPPRTSISTSPPPSGGMLHETRPSLPFRAAASVMEPPDALLPRDVGIDRIGGAAPTGFGDGWRDSRSESALARGLRDVGRLDPARWF